MKQFYILTLCALVGASSAMADGGRHFKSHKSQRKQAQRTEAAAPLWRTASETVYMMYDPEEGGWIEPSETTFTYDSRGNVVASEMNDGYEKVRTVMEYDEFNKMTSQLITVENEDGEWENESRRIYKYDPVVHDFYTERMAYNWTGTDWESNYMCETNAVTRDDRGNIVEIVKSLPYDGEALIPAYKAIWNYDEATGKADAFEYFENIPSETGEEQWQLYGSTSYRNLVWAATDGQLTATSMYELTEGDNRIISSEVYYEGELDGHFLVEYDEATPGAYVLKETFADPKEVGRSISKEILDANGSFRITSAEYFDEENNLTAEPTYVSVEEYILDAHGHLVSEKMYEGMDGEEPMLVYEGKTDYVYDDNGNPTEYTAYYYDEETEEFVPTEHVEYGEYTDLSGVESVTENASSAVKAVYNLQGVCVAKSADSLSSLPAGLYITGGKKVVVK